MCIINQWCHEGVEGKHREWWSHYVDVDRAQSLYLTQSTILFSTRLISVVLEENKKKSL